LRRVAAVVGIIALMAYMFVLGTVSAPEPDVVTDVPSLITDVPLSPALGIPRKGRVPVSIPQLCP
jgi:hypothetical protein